LTFRKITLGVSSVTVGVIPTMPLLKVLVKLKEL
jgi:hypothetical protein